MPPVPDLSSRDVVRVLESLGWEVARQRGSHIILVKAGQLATLSVPAGRHVAKGTLRTLIRNAELTVHEFVRALEAL